LLGAIKTITASEQHALFKPLFLDNSPDWRNLANTPVPNKHKDELTSDEAFNYLFSMSPTERVWFYHMAAQHCKANPSTHFIELISAHRYFFAQIKEIDAKLELPCPCPITNSENMKTAYVRVLAVLRKAVDPFEQVKHLKLDWSMQGAICASRSENYVFMNEAMQLTPLSGITNWEKFRSYIPKVSPAGAEHKPELVAERNTFIKEYKKYRKDKDQAPKTYRPPNDFFTDLYKKSSLGQGALDLVVSLFFVPYRTYFLQGLDRNNTGRLRTVEVSQYFEMDHEVMTIKLIDNSAIQDESIMTRQDKLAYGINLQELTNLSTLLTSNANLCRYFYRFVGTEPYSFAFSCYEHLAATLDDDSLWLENNAVVNKKSLFQNQLMPLLAVSTTGARALKANENNQNILLQLIAYTLSHSEELKDGHKPNKGKISRLTQHLVKTKYPPILSETLTLLSLPLDKKALNDVFATVNKNGSVIYKVLVNLQHHKTAVLPDSLGTYCQQLKQINLPHQEANNAILLLSSLLPMNEAQLLLSDSDTLFKKGYDVEMLSYLTDILSQVNVAASNDLPNRNDINSLIAKLDQIDKKDPDKYAIVYAITRKTLPQLKFNDASVATSLAVLIRSLAPLATEIDLLRTNILALMKRICNWLKQLRVLSLKGWLVTF